MYGLFFWPDISGALTELIYIFSGLVFLSHLKHLKLLIKMDLLYDEESSLFL